MLPKNIEPECWNDQQRLNVLFAPIRPRSVNPHDWNSKYNFWKALISDYCDYCGIYIFKVSDLEEAFKKDGKTPKCLEMVVKEMERTGECVPLSNFLEKNAENWTAWAANIFIKKPLMWSFKTIKDAVLQPEKDVTYVHEATVRKKARQLLISLPNDRKNKVLSLGELLALTKDICDGVNNIKLLLHFLVNENKAAIKELHTTSTDTKDKYAHFLIKLDDKRVQPITDVEIGIHTLEQNENALLENIEKLEDEIVEMNENAKRHLSKGHRHMAKTCLRKKHALENCLTKRSNALQNVQTLLARVHEANTDGQVLESYKIALSSLKETFKSAGLSEDAVSETMLEMGEVSLFLFVAKSKVLFVINHY